MTDATRASERIEQSPDQAYQQHVEHLLERIASGLEAMAMDEAAEYVRDVATASGYRLSIDRRAHPAPGRTDGEAGWPEGVSDGLTLKCHDCGQVPRFDYSVTDDFWSHHVPGPEHTSVVCLPCLDLRCGGIGLAAALTQVQWTGSSHTVVLTPVQRYEFDAAMSSEAVGERSRRG